jgi:type 1 glutamine amidotransferase
MKATLILGVATLLPMSAMSEERAPEGAAEKIAGAMPVEAFAKPEEPRRLLVFSRTAGYRHESIATGKLALAEMGKRTGAFEAVISDDLANFEPGRIGAFDAILFLSTTQNAFRGADDEKRLQDSLMAFVKGGKGFVGIHAATDTFYEWPEYGRMMCGYFDGHPWTADTRVHVFVEPGQEKHPLVAMFGGKPVEFKEEIYQFKDPYDSSQVHMLLRLDPSKSDKVRGKKRDDNDYGVSWARHWGDGRVFYSSLGHNHHIYWNPKVLRHYLAGIQWALGDYRAEVTK